VAYVTLKWQIDLQRKDVRMSSATSRALTTDGDKISMLAAGRVQELHQIRQLDQRFLKDLLLLFHWKSVTSDLQQLYVYISAIESESGQTHLLSVSLCSCCHNNTSPYYHPQQTTQMIPFHQQQQQFFKKLS
jgi:hypothetical protein